MAKEQGIESCLLSDEEIRYKLEQIQPEGFDWVTTTDTEMIKFQAIAQAEHQKHIDSGYLSPEEVQEQVAEAISKLAKSDEQMREAICKVIDSGISIGEIADNLSALFAASKAEAVKKLNNTKVICLCGSTRFTNQMLIKQWELTKQGNVVLSWCALPDSYFKSKDKAHIGDQEGVKKIVDEVHKRKIDLCDEVFVLNIGGYIGESTASEIAYATKLSRPITYWQALQGGQSLQQKKE